MFIDASQIKFCSVGLNVFSTDFETSDLCMNFIDKHDFNYFSICIACSKLG